MPCGKGPILILGLCKRTVLGLAVAGSVAAAEPEVVLKLRQRAGEQREYRLVTESSPPRITGLGTVRTELTYQVATDARDPRLMMVSIDGTSSRPEVAVRPTQATVRIVGGASTGTPLSLQIDSEALEDPVNGAFVRQIESLLPPIPTRPLVPGDSWSAPTRAHQPKLPVPGGFTILDTVTTWTYRGREPGAGPDLHRIDFEVRHESETRRLRVAGHALFDAARSRPVRLTGSGVYQSFQTVLFTGAWFDTPTRFELVEIGTGVEPAFPGVGVASERTSPEEGAAGIGEEPLAALPVDGAPGRLLLLHELGLLGP